MDTKVKSFQPSHSCYLHVKVGLADYNHVTLLGCLDIEEGRFSSDNCQDANKLTGEGRVQVVLKIKFKAKSK